MPHSKPIYLGIKGSVLAIDGATGRRLWTVHLKGSDYVNVVLDGGSLYATTKGEIFCLDPRTGEGRWHDPLTGFGLGLVSIAGEGITSGPALLQVEAQRRRQQSSTTAATGGTTVQ